MDQLVIKDPGETLEPRECRERMARQGIPGSQDLKVTPASAGPRGLQGSLGPKDRLVEWACQEHPEKKACLGSPARRASLAYPGRKAQRARKGRQASLALGFRAGLATREIKGLQDFREVLERRERKEAWGSRGSLALLAPKDPLGALAIQEALACLGIKGTEASQDRLAFPVSREKQVFLGSLAPWAQLARKGSLAVTESRGRRERRGNQACLEEHSQGSQGPKERKVQRVMWVSRDKLGVQEFPDPKESKDSWVPRGHKDSRAYPELRATLWRDLKETGAHRVSLACQGFRDPWGLRGSPGLMD